jgi:hypothetical protein
MSAIRLSDEHDVVLPSGRTITVVFVDVDPEPRGTTAFTMRSGTDRTRHPTERRFARDARPA